MTRDRTEVVPGEVCIRYWGELLHRKGCQALEEAGRSCPGFKLPFLEVFKEVRMWHLGMWFSSGLGSAGGMVDLRGLFQPKLFCEISSHLLDHSGPDAVK